MKWNSSKIKRICSGTLEKCHPSFTSFFLVRAFFQIFVYSIPELIRQKRGNIESLLILLATLTPGTWSFLRGFRPCFCGMWADNYGLIGDFMLSCILRCSGYCVAYRDGCQAKNDLRRRIEILQDFFVTHKLLHCRVVRGNHPVWLLGMVWSVTKTFIANITCAFWETVP